MLCCEFEQVRPQDILFMFFGLIVYLFYDQITPLRRQQELN